MSSDEAAGLSEHKFLQCFARIPLAFQDLFNEGFRDYAFFGGRGGGKSHAVAGALVIQAAMTPLRIVCAREVQSSLRDSVQALIEDKIADFGLGKHFECLRDETRGLNGSLFLYKGLSRNPDAIKSLEGADVFWAEEANRLDGVDPRLVKVVKRAIQLTTVDFKVIEGVRSDDQAYRNWGKGRTAAECRAVGAPTTYARPAEAKVTWVRRPLNTRHRRQANGYGGAVDLLPAPYDCKATEPFDAVAKAMHEAAGELGVTIRWGADWDSDGCSRERGEVDSPHFELAQ